MPTERMEEVEVRMNEAEHLGQLIVQRATPSDPYLRFTAEPEPGSLTSARLRLADAAEAVSASGVRIPVEALDTHEKQVAWLAFADKLAALRTARGEG